MCLPFVVHRINLSWKCVMNWKRRNTKHSLRYRCVYVCVWLLASKICVDNAYCAKMSCVFGLLFKFTFLVHISHRFHSFYWFSANGECEYSTSIITFHHHWRVRVRFPCWLKKNTSISLVLLFSSFFLKKKIKFLFIDTRFIFWGWHHHHLLLCYCVCVCVLNM